MTIVHRSKAFRSKRNNNAQRSMCCTERAQSIGQQCHQAAGAHQAASWRTARCAQDWIGADGPPPLTTADCRRTEGRLRTTAGYPSEFSTKHITCDFSTTVCCLIVHCDAQKMITAIHGMYVSLGLAQARTCINFS